MNDHETALIRAFIDESKQERFVEMLGSTKRSRRKKLVASLSHFKYLKPETSQRLDSSETSETLLNTLASMGAPKACHVISEFSDLDGTEQPLASVLERVFASGMATFLSCIPGKLAYFDNEDGRWLLKARKELR